MGLPSSRLMFFHRLVLLPPLALLTLTCLYTSSDLRPFGSTRRLSFSQDVQCFSCESSSSFSSRSFLSLANFPASSYIRDIVVRHNVLNVEDSRVETTTEPGSRRDMNEEESFDYGQKSSEKTGPDVAVDVPHRDTTRTVEEEDEEQPAEKSKVDGDNVAPTEQKIIDNSAPAAESIVGNSVLSDSTAESSGPVDQNADTSVQVVEISFETTKANLEEGRKEDVDSSVPELGENAHKSDEAEEFSSEAKDNLQDSTNIQDGDSSVPVDKNVDTSVQAEENLYSGMKDKSESHRKENFEGDGKKNRQLENRHLTSDDHVSPEEHIETPTERNVGVTESVPAPPPLQEIEVMRFWHENMSKEVEFASIAVQNQVDAITKSGLPTESVNAPNAEDLDVNLLLRGDSPQGVPLREEQSCEGRHIFVYNLPSKFNVDLVGQCDTLLHWLNFCEYFMNGGMGTNVPTDELNDRGEKVLVPDGSWFLTHQYALELIFHARLKQYPCLTTDANRADLFFVPYYAGLDVIRWHFKPNITNDQRDELTVELMDWLEGEETWSRNKGIDHVFVLGKISWDFRRSSRSIQWGSKLLALPEMTRPTKVLIERDPWHPNDIGVPHPTFFHPKDDNEIRTWLAHVEQSERRYLVSFAGMPRPNMKTNVRGHLIQQCLDNPDDCFLLRCVRTVCMRPDSTMNLFLHSHFCMQPPGDSPTRRSVFDSLVGGCIPVLFDPYTAYYQYPWHLPRNDSSYSVFIPSSDVMSGKSDIVKILKSITSEERTAMRTRIIREIIPGLLYSQPGTTHSDFRDSFDISIEALLHRVANLRAGQNSM